MIRTITILLLASCSLLQAAPLKEGIETFRRAYRNWDSAQFWNATRELQASVAAKPDSATNHTWLGTAHFHRMLQIESRPATPELRAAAAGDREQAIEALEKAVELDASQAEAHAMLGTLYGMKIDGVINGMRHGRKVQKHKKLALQHGANNPRVQYLLGVGRLKTAKKPDEIREALKTLLQAETLFIAESKQQRPADAAAWGRDACLAFIGKAYLELQNPDKARVYFSKALKVRPNNHMAKAGLKKLK